MAVFLKTRQNFTICTKKIFIKLQNVCDPYMDVKWMGLFFSVFINHFPKIHRSVLCQITIDQLYYDANLWEKNYGKSTAYKAEAVFPITHFKADRVIGRRFSKIVVRQCSFFVPAKAWRNACDRFHFSSLFISSPCLLFY